MWLELLLANKRQKLCNILILGVCRYLDSAKAVALSGPGVGGRSGTSFRIGAVLVSGKEIVVSRHNSYKTHPKLLRFTEYPFLHAEAACILSVGIEGCKGMDIYVARVLKNGATATARPCKVCRKLIRLAEIRRVTYTLENNNAETF